MVNKTNLGPFIDCMKTLKESDYDQAIVNGGDCGTPMCILGHGIAFFKDKLPHQYGVRGQLGLTNKQGDKLFDGYPMEKHHPTSIVDPIENVKLADAIATLEHLYRTGKVQWKRG